MIETHCAVPQRDQRRRRLVHYSLEAAERANALFARTEALNHYWQALNWFERLPDNSDRNRAHARVLLSTMLLPGFVRDDAARAQMLRHVDRALENALKDGDPTAAVKQQVSKGSVVHDEMLLVDGLARAKALGDMPTLAFAEQRYGQYLGVRGQFENSLAHVARSIELMGAQGQVSEELALYMSAGGRCYAPVPAGSTIRFATQSASRRCPTPSIIRAFGRGLQ